MNARSLRAFSLLRWLAQSEAVIHSFAVLT